MFSQTVEYALRAAVYLASRAGDPATTDDVARVTKVPPAYLAKVLQGLGRAGVISARRGVGGGITLARDSSALTILDIVNAVEPIRRITTCPLGLPSHGKRLCPLHAKIDAAIAGYEVAFGSTTLADLLAEPTDSIPLCDATPTGRRVPIAVRRS